jgi:hypothetical protein
MRCGIVVERRDERMSIESRLHPAALDSRPAAVNQPHFPQTGCVGRLDVLLDDGGDVARVERVQVERVLDRHTNRRLVRHRVTPLSIRCRAVCVEGFSYEAVTRVVMPPRTEKSPTTVMRRGRQASASSSRMRFVTAS